MPLPAVPRPWNIVVHQHDDDSFTARVWVDGKLLLPDCVGRSADVTLSYVEQALIDVRPDDQLSVRAQGKKGLQTSRVGSALAARRWFAERVSSPADSAPESQTIALGEPSATRASDDE